MKNKKLTAVVAVILVAVLVAGFAIWAKYKPVSNDGEKTITVTVVADGKEDEFTIKTNAEYLSGALKEINLIEGSESEYGLFVTKVNGREADSTKEEWWCFTKEGESTMGVDITPIADGDHFEITLTVGYDV